MKKLLFFALFLPFFAMAQFSPVIYLPSEAIDISPKEISNKNSFPAVLQNDTLWQFKNDSIFFFVKSFAGKKQDINVENKVWGSAEVMPEYPGGDKNLLLSIQNNFTPSKESKKAFRKSCSSCSGANFEYSFIINEYGNITDIKTIKGTGTIIDNDVINSIKTLRFFPATISGKPIKMKYRIPLWLNI